MHLPTVSEANLDLKPHPFSRSYWQLMPSQHFQVHCWTGGGGEAQGNVNLKRDTFKLPWSKCTISYPDSVCNALLWVESSLGLFKPAASVFRLLDSSFTTVVHSSALWAHELDLVLWSSVFYNNCTLQEIASREMENSSTLGIFEQRWTKPLIHISFVNRLYPGAGRPPVVDSLQNSYYYYALSIYIPCDVTGQLIPLRGGVYFLSICIWAGLMICFGQ